MMSRPGRSGGENVGAVRSLEACGPMAGDLTVAVVLEAEGDVVPPRVRPPFP